jgi:peptidoglycan hydrolase-like protein with peptidoglycan-binding domain
MAHMFRSEKEEIDFDGPIERGAKKMRAQRVQEFLTLNGFAVSIDGDFDPATEKRVRDFQTARGLPATGVVDMKTHEELVARPS